VGAHRRIDGAPGHPSEWDRVQLVGLLVGNIVGMAYVVARPRGRYEIRESVHTPKGPRARSLANFSRLDDEVLARARRRASRPFDADAVRASAARAATTRTATAPDVIPRHERPETLQFVGASRRMARALERTPERAARQDPGDALIDLLGFVDQIQGFRAAGRADPLRFPPLGRLRARRPGPADRPDDR